MDRFKILFRYNRSRTLGIFICALLLLLNCTPVFAAEEHTSKGAGVGNSTEQGSEDTGGGAFTKVSSNAAIGTAGVERQNEERILDVTDLSNRVSVLYMRDNGLPTSDACRHPMPTTSSSPMTDLSGSQATAAWSAMTGIIFTAMTLQWVYPTRPASM